MTDAALTADAAGDWVKAHRRMRHHPVVGFLNEDGTRRAGVVVCEMTAWMDLCMEASWKDRQVNNKGKVTLLERGQFVAARRWLADRWGWTEDKVRWFLKKLQNEGMIALVNQSVNQGNHTQSKPQKAAHYANVLSVCNYNVYQAVTELDTLLNTQRNTQSTPNQHPHTKKERKKDKIQSAIADSSPAAPIDMFARADEMAAERSGRTASKVATVAMGIMAAALPAAAAIPPMEPPAHMQQQALPVPTLTPKTMTRAEAITRATDEWNALADRCGLPKIKILNQARQAALILRIKEAGSFQAFVEAIRKIESSPFLCGQNERGWRANIKFVLQPSSFAQLLEGGYDRSKAPPPQVKPGPGVNGSNYSFSGAYVGRTF